MLPKMPAKFSWCLTATTQLGSDMRIISPRMTVIRNLKDGHS